MQKTIRTTVEKEFDIQLAPELLTQEYIDNFESYMFELKGDDLEEKQDSLFQYAARMIAEHGVDFIEGLGKVEKLIYSRPAKVIYQETECWTDTEVV